MRVLGWSFRLMERTETSSVSLVVTRFKAPVVGLPIDLLNNSYTNVSEEFTTKVLATMINDEIGLLCKKDQFLLIFGNRLFCKIKRREGKKMDTVKTIRANIRRLGHLYHIFQQRNTENRHKNLLDMFERLNFEFLRDSISEYTVVEGGQTKKFKCGLKHVLQYTIQTAAKILKGTFLVRERDDLSKTMDNFLAIFKLNKDEIFGDAEYQLNKNCQIRLRKPANIPLESDVKLLRDHIVGNIYSIISNEYLFWDSHLYVELREY